jgi:formylglycine-generating enzyme required for sulfatase activity
VVQIAWRDAQAFCDWLSRKEGKKYRLPTEAEWEYGGRVGIRLPVGNDGPSLLQQ